MADKEIIGEDGKLISERYLDPYRSKLDDVLAEIKSYNLPQYLKDELEIIALRLWSALGDHRFYNRDRHFLLAGQLDDCKAFADLIAKIHHEMGLHKRRELNCISVSDIFTSDNQYVACHKLYSAIDQSVGGVAFICDINGYSEHASYRYAKDIVHNVIESIPDDLMVIFSAEQDDMDDILKEDLFLRFICRIDVEKFV